MLSVLDPCPVLWIAGMARRIEVQEAGRCVSGEGFEPYSTVFAPETDPEQPALLKGQLTGKPYIGAS